jgi:hypothetical protein
MASSYDTVVGLYENRNEFVKAYKLPQDTLEKIRNVRTLCENAEKNETGAVSWRRGAGGNTSHRSDGGRHPPPHSGTTPKPNWRSSGHGHGFNRNGSGVQGQGGEKTTHTRYVSKFVNTDAPVEDKILNQIILNKLNKFSVANYQEVKEFVQQILDGDETNFIRDFMLLVFKKAACEPTFCPLYAKLLSELRAGYPQLQDELNTLYGKYMTIFEEIDEKKCKDYEQFVQRNKEKLHRLGYSQFLGELTRLGVLDESQHCTLYGKLLTQITSVASEESSRQILVEEYVDCLLRMTNALKSSGIEKVEAIRRALKNSCEGQLERLLATRSSLPGLSKKAAFAIMDCLDILRATA